MKVVVISGSYRRKGASAFLADRFIDGAREAGHEVFRFDAAFETVGGCRGCDYCARGTKPCVQNDGMSVLNPHLVDADFVAFVTPLHHFHMSAQLKAVIDRFYANDARLMGGKRAVLRATAKSGSSRTIQGLVDSYMTIIRYLSWANAGEVLALGCGDRNLIEVSVFPDAACRLGVSLK
ncbi:MAG: flavodoxin family protein [Actinomycetota bacterium]|nr:MAG: NADPH-dependent FMN [Actinomycetota bacterium]MDO8950499.1 flavodoxin family protein [Actinomycetota bacterium]MDP3630741.1 flavodoxin family protein [Actinomycetota bacterium]